MGNTKRQRVRMTRDAGSRLELTKAVSSVCPILFKWSSLSRYSSSVSEHTQGEGAHNYNTYTIIISEVSE